MQTAVVHSYKRKVINWFAITDFNFGIHFIASFRYGRHLDRCQAIFNLEDILRRCHGRTHLTIDDHLILFDAFDGIPSHGSDIALQGI